MHPILANHRRLLLYLLAWTPILGLLVYMSAALTGVPAWWALEVFAPACLVFAFVCLSPWQICRARPLRPGQAAPLLYLFLGAGTAGSLAFLGTAASVAYAISRASVLNGGVVGMLFGLGILLYLLSAGLHYAALAVEASHQAEKRAAEARTLAREAQLESLRIQLNPHFLFNSLHSIAALATLDGGRAREMCVRLADFLRSSLGLGEREIIPLGEELALARQYLEVERVRFGARLRVETADRGGLRELRRARAAAAAAGGERRQARDGRDWWRAAPSAWQAERSGRRSDHHAGKRLRPGECRRRGTWRHGAGARAPAAAGALRAKRPVSQPAARRRRLPRGAAAALRIAHGLQQPGVAGAADRQAGAVGEDGDAALLAVGLDARDALQVDDGGAVNAHEAGRDRARLPGCRWAAA